jgi:heme exporter protein C
MKKNWWKALGALLIIYTIILGLYPPIKPALITESNKSIPTAKSGEALTLTMNGYNTHFTEGGKLTAWLSIVDGSRNADGKPNVFSTMATTVKPTDNTHLELSFAIPKHLPLSKNLQSADVVVNAGTDGLLVRKSAVQISQDSINADLGRSLWLTAVEADVQKYKTFSFPNLAFTRETIRNTYFHVPMWFTMYTLFAMGMWYSVQHLRRKDMASDLKAVSYTRVGTFFGLLGLVTGGTWANFAWGEPFPIQEIKLLMTYTAIAIYLAYFILRGSFDDFEKRARISAVYSIFAFASLIPLLYVIPKLSQTSLHPNTGENQSIAAQDMENTMRMVFYPACIGWILIGLWVAQLVVRSEFLQDKIMTKRMAN